MPVGGTPGHTGVWEHCSSHLPSSKGPDASIHLSRGGHHGWSIRRARNHSSRRNPSGSRLCCSFTQWMVQIASTARLDGDRPFILGEAEGRMNRKVTRQAIRPEFAEQLQQHPAQRIVATATATRALNSAIRCGLARTPSIPRMRPNHSDSRVKRMKRAFLARKPTVRVGFEPTETLLPRTISSRVPSTARPPHLHAARRRAWDRSRARRAPAGDQYLGLTPLPRCSGLRAGLAQGRLRLRDAGRAFSAVPSSGVRG